MRKKASDGEKHSQAVSVLKAVRQMVQFHRGNFFDWCRKEALRQKLWWGGGGASSRGGWRGAPVGFGKRRRTNSVYL